MHEIRYSFTAGDYVIIALYFILIIALGFWGSRKKTVSTDREGFLLAGRKLTLPLFVATLVSTWYGSILGVGEFVYTNGLVAWVCFGLPYYIAAAIFAFFIAKKVRNSNVCTIPEQIEKKYGKTAGTISSFLVLLFTIPASYILMLGIIIRMFTGFDLTVSIAAGALFSLIYLFKGGFKADITANTAQFIMMFLGFGILLFFAITKLGSPSHMVSLLPPLHKDFFGGFSWQVVFAWYVIAFQTFVDPSFHQRCSATKSPSVAQKGILVSIGCWAVFDFLTLITGLYAKAYFHDIVPVESYPVLSNNILPPLWKGFFVASMIAPVMAALDGLSFISAATIGNDLLGPVINNKDRNFSAKKLTNIGLIITSITAVLMAAALPSVVQLIYRTASIAVPALLLPLIISFSDKFRYKGKGVLLNMIFAGSASMIWTLLRMINVPSTYFITSLVQNVEPIVPGIVMSGIISIFVIKQYSD